MGATRRGAILAALGALAAGAAVVALTRRGADEGDPVAAAAPRSVEELRAAVIATETTSVPSDRAPVADAEGPRAAPTARLEPVVLARVFDASRRPIAGVHAMVIAFLRASRYVDSLDGLVAIEKDWVRQFGVRLEPANAGLFPFRASPSAMGFHDALVTLASTVPVRRSPDPAVPDALILDVVERQWSVVTRADGCVALDSPLPDAWFGIRVTAGLVDERYSGDAEAPAAVKVDGETSARGGLALVLPDPPGNARVSFRVIEEGTGSPVRQATIELERPAVLVSQGTSGDLLFARLDSRGVASIRLKVRSAEHRSATLDLATPLANADSPYEVRLTRLGVQGGVVRSTAGDPIVGASIRAISFGSDVEAPRRATSGDFGRFRMRGLERSPYRLEVSADGYFSSERTIEGPASGVLLDDVEIELTPCARLQGCVRDASGSGKAGARVTLKGSGIERTVTSADGGWFSFEELRGGRYAVDAGGAPSELDLAEGATAETSLVCAGPEAKAR